MLSHSFAKWGSVSAEDKTRKFNKLLGNAIKKGDAEAAKAAIDQGADANGKFITSDLMFNTVHEGIGKNSFLKEAIMISSVPVVQVLVNAKANVNEDGILETVLEHRLRASDCFAILKCLIKGGADLNGIKATKRAPFIKPERATFLDTLMWKRDMSSSNTTIHSLNKVIQGVKLAGAKTAAELNRERSRKLRLQKL